MVQGSGGHAYRAYRFPHRKGGRLSRRPAGRLGPIAGGIGAFLLAMIAMGGVAAAAVFGYFASDLPAAHDLATVQIPLSTHIYDRTGEHLLYTLEDQRRELITLGEIPEKMQQATVSIEDKTFWTNPGVDFAGILRAISANQAAGRVVGGGSTITQQLIKQRLLGDDPTLARKIKEAILAVEVTRTFDKKQILEMYFNQIYYGNQAYGIRSAAKTYFGVSDLSKLTLGQIALLAGLPQLPSEYDPIQNPDAARTRRAAVLDTMVDNKYITEAEAEAAKNEPIKVQAASTSLYAPHFTFRVREQIVRELGEKNAYNGGYTILTSLDWNMQQLAEKELRDHVDSLKGSNVNNAALITMDPTTGEVLAYVGSYDYYENTPTMRGDYDHAGIALRQPGSTFKLFTYLAGMEKAGMTAATRLYDIAWKQPDGSGKTYAPQDATKEQHGPTTMRQALRESLNLPALQVARTVGVDGIIDVVHQLGIDRDFGDRSRLGLSFGIGAAEMRLIDMASAYQVIANMGTRVEPTMIMKIIDRNGKVVRDFTKPEGRQVIDPRMAWIMADILKDNTDPNGSFVFGPWTNIGRPAALKTGTTDNLQDVLAIGFTPTRLTAIWMGNSDNSEMRGISSALGPGVLWRDYMKTVVGALPVTWYPKPDGIVTATVCTNPSLLGGNGSGELPGPNCPAGFRRTENFIAGTEPKKNDSDFYLPGGCINLRAPFADWQKDYNAWAADAVAGKFSYGRFNWSICGVASSPSPSSSTSALPSFTYPPGLTQTPTPTGPTVPPTPTPRVTVPPLPTPPPPTKKP